MAVLNFATVARDDRDVQLLTHNPLKGLPCPSEDLAKIEHVAGIGFHSARRKFASEMKSTNLRDLAYMEGWKSPQTILTVYQQPEIEVQREALAGRKKLRVAG
jgi:uncharacterized protein YeaO (DUF488 family)